MDASVYLKSVTLEFSKLYNAANKATEQIKPEQLLTSPSPESNSIAIIMKHISGNMFSRWTNFLTTDGEKENRNRDQEFEINNNETIDSIIKKWHNAWECLFSALGTINQNNIESTIIIRKEKLTVVEAINRQLTHYGQHIGQIIYLSRYFTGSAWKTLSIPRGGSQIFNKNPTLYK